MKGKATWIVHGAVVRHHHPCFLMINDDWTFYLIQIKYAKRTAYRWSHRTGGHRADRTRNSPFVSHKGRASCTRFFALARQRCMFSPKEQMRIGAKLQWLLPLATFTTSPPSPRQYRPALGLNIHPGLLHLSPNL